ncbi:MAG TPA: methylmalonyl Co-A mutase-associated GTPase MeaB [Flavisolibacter sp.]|nr:methylmalonyl Co-A mutase-associated GTPase MeaB [Flavisolibacter sp.]
MWQHLLEQINKHDIRALARSISLVENEYEGYEELMLHLPAGRAAIIGITGPPGAGKSTLTDGLVGEIVNQGKKVAVICVDPSSPFHMGAVLGDRIRMSQWYTHPGVFIRSLATRGSMGGLHPKIIEITDLVNAAQFDFIIVETVGVGQSEIEIAGLADTTVVVVVPEAGDEVQTMKAGLMEIADIFVVNKADRPDADTFVKNLRLMLAPAFSQHEQEIPIIKTIAHENKGLQQLYNTIVSQRHRLSADRKVWLLTEKIWVQIQKQRMKDISRTEIAGSVASRLHDRDFNLYRLVQQYAGLV